MAEPCRLCDDTATGWVTTADGCTYYQCQRCGVIQLGRESLPTRTDEEARYRLHNNSPDDPRYQRYIQRIYDGIASHLPRALGAARWLDIGCGPTPLLAETAAARGWLATSYDPIFFPEESVLDERAHVVSLVEAIEHLHWPMRDLDRYAACVEPGGLFAVRTAVWTGEAEDFDRWWYRRDETHVQFLTPLTVEFLVEALGFARVVEVDEHRTVSKATGRPIIGSTTNLYTT